MSTGTNPGVALNWLVRFPVIGALVMLAIPTTSVDPNTTGRRFADGITMTRAPLELDPPAAGKRPDAPTQVMPKRLKKKGGGG